MRRLPATTMYYALDFALSLPAFVVTAVYFVREVHMSPLQLVVVGTVMEAAVFLSEIPTGAFADTYGRRRSLVLAFLVTGGATMAVGAVPSFWPIVVFWGIWGVGYTFESGAYQAWITDEVGAANVGSVFLRGTRFAYAGALIGLLLEVALALWSLQAAVVAGGAVTVLCGVACVFGMPETGFVPKPKEEREHGLREVAATARTAGRFVRAQPLILLMLGATFFAGMSSEAFDRLSEAHFIRDVGLPGVGSLDPIVWFALFGAGSLFVGLFASTVLIRRFERAGVAAASRSLFALTALLAAAEAGFGLAAGLGVAVAAFLVARLLRTLVYPVYMTWLNQQITDSSVRATVISISGQADAIGQAGGGPLLGVVGNVWGIRAALVAGAAVLVPALGLYGRAVRHGGVEPELEELPEAAPA